jgi:hypothetical protein
MGVIARSTVYHATGSQIGSESAMGGVYGNYAS